VGADLSEHDLHGFAAKSMPKYLRPSHIRVIGEIPRTPTLKIEKYKLRAQILDEPGPA
jgi:crotonobetaine/carnitine-CoA ligase